MKVLICGSRNFDNKELIRQVIDSLPSDTVIIHGAASGADTIAGTLAKERGLKVVEFPADWKKYGRSAGPIRNKQMLTESVPDRIHAFYTDKSKSKGTASMVKQAKRKGIEVFEYES